MITFSNSIFSNGHGARDTESLRRWSGMSRLDLSLDRRVVWTAQVLCTRESSARTKVFAQGVVTHCQLRGNRLSTLALGLMEPVSFAYQCAPRGCKRRNSGIFRNSIKMFVNRWFASQSVARFDPFTANRRGGVRGCVQINHGYSFQYYQPLARHLVYLVVLTHG